MVYDHSTLENVNKRQKEYVTISPLIKQLTMLFKGFHDGGCYKDCHGGNSGRLLPNLVLVDKSGLTPEKCQKICFEQHFMFGKLLTLTSNNLHCLYLMINELLSGCSIPTRMLVWK